jgi:WD40 repeat protein
VRISPDGTRLASANQDHAVKIWNIADGREVLTLKGHLGEIQCLEFSSDGKLLATGSKDKTVKVWDLADGKEVHSLQGHREPVRGLRFSPNGQRLLSAARFSILDLEGNAPPPFDLDKTRELATEVKVWDLADGKEVFSRTGYKTSDLLGAVAFSPDGRRIALASGQFLKGEVKLWDIPTGRELLTLRGHPANIYGILFSPDGRRLVTASRAGDIKVWDARPLEAGPDQ